MIDNKEALKMLLSDVAIIDIKKLEVDYTNVISYCIEMVKDAKGNIKDLFVVTVENDEPVFCGYYEYGILLEDLGSLSKMVDRLTLKYPKKS